MTTLMMTLKREDNLKNIFTEAHNTYKKDLNARAFFKVHDHTISEDLVQDTFIKTWIYLVKTGKIETMKAFLYHVLNNLIIDEYRRKKTTSLDVLAEKGFEPAMSITENLSDLLDGKRASLLIQLLPKKYQKIIHMKYIQDLTLKEMSLITGQSKNTLAVQAHRGLERLKILYKHQ